MPIADFNYEDFDQARQKEQDEKLLVKFYLDTTRDKEASEKQGRAVFKEREFVDIRVPGQRGTVVIRPATDRDRARFPRHYAAFKQRVELPMEGTPLKEWPVISRSLAEELAFSGVKTVEQLANVPDHSISAIMGGKGFKAKAQAWLDRAQAEVSLNQMEAELAKRDKLIEEMQAKLSELTADKPKRKRRTKEEIARDNELRDTGQRPTEPGSG